MRMESPSLLKSAEEGGARAEEYSWSKVKLRDSRPLCRLLAVIGYRDFSYSEVR